MTKWTPGRCPWPGHQFISASLVGFDFAAMKDLFVDFCIVAPDGGLANSVHRLVTLTKYPEKGCCSFALRGVALSEAWCCQLQLQLLLRWVGFGEDPLRIISHAKSFHHVAIELVSLKCQAVRLAFKTPSCPALPELPYSSWATPSHSCFGWWVSRSPFCSVALS